MERVLHILTASHSRITSLPNLRSSSLRCLYNYHAWNAVECDLERRDGNRAAEEGGSALGEEVEMEIDRVGVWAVFSTLDIAVQPAQH